LHELITEKYKDEGVLFWTFFNYLDQCFVEDGADNYRTKNNVTNLESCYDWSTVIIEGNEEVDYLHKCVRKSFGGYEDYERDNIMLKKDAEWAIEHNMNFHPSVAINNITYTRAITLVELAMSICAAYREKPDECDLSWKIKTFQHGIMDIVDADASAMPTENDDMLNMALKYMNNTEAQNIANGTKL
jgi:hypothetical protein